MDTDTATPLLARLDHVRAWLRDHAELGPYSVTATEDAAIIHLPLEQLLRIGAPTRISDWLDSPYSLLGSRVRHVYLSVDGITLTAVQSASADDVAASEAL